MERSKQKTKKRPLSERRNEILCFSDVFDNLSDFQELDIVPKQLIQEMKEDKTKICTIIEYASSNIAVVDNSLLICNESIEKYYKTCMDILIDFREKISGTEIMLKKGITRSNLRNMKLKPIIDDKFRTLFVEDFGTNGIWSEKSKEAEKPIDVIKRLHKGEGYDKKLYADYGLSPMYLKIVELASKILLCFNGELNMAFNVRIDLILLNVIKDFKGELEVLRLSLKKFRKSYIGWFYRRLIFSVNFALKSHLLEDRYFKGDNFESKDFLGIQNLWENEYEVVVEASLQKNRSYKLWEHLSLIQIKMKQYLVSLLENDKAKEQNKTEVEIFLIEVFSGYYEKAKTLCSKDIHNNCIFEYLTNLLRIMFSLKIDDFMGEKEFYKQFMEDHVIWVDGLLQYHKSLLEANKKENQKWVALTMIDYSKLESLKAHKNITEEWDEFMKFYSKL